MKTKLNPAVTAVAALCSLVSINPVQAQTLDTQVVVASRLEEPLSEVLPAVSVVTRSDIQKQNAEDIYDVLLGIPGIELSRMGGAGSPISVYARGASSSQTLVLLDGVPFSAQGTIGALSPLETIPLQVIERIEILRGNASAVYGPGAVGGVIQIFTSGEGTLGPRASVTTGSKDTHQTMVGWSGKSGQTSLRFSVGQNKSRGIESLSHQKYPAVNPGLNGYSNEFVNGSVTHAISSQTKLTLHYFGSLLNSEFDNNYANSSSDLWKNKSKTEVLGMQLDQRLTSQWRSTLQLAQSINDQSTLTNGQLNASYGAFVTQHQTLRWNNEFEMSPRDIVSVGFSSARSTLDANHTGYLADWSEIPVSLKPSMGIQRVHGAWNGIRQRWNFQATLGHEMLPNQVHGTTYLLGAGYAIGHGYKATFTRSNALQAPTVGQLYDVSFGGSQTLKPERSQSTEFGFQFNGEKRQWRIVTFRTNYTDLIAVGNNLVADPFWSAQNIMQLENVNKAKNTGLEASYKQQLGPVQLAFNWTHQTPVNIDSTVVVMNKSRNFGSLGVDYAMDGQSSLSLKIFGTGQRKTFDPNSKRVDTAGYAVMNLGYKRALTPSWTATASVHNALDKTYFHVAGYNNLPRTYMVGLRYQGK